jgi:hypothetical protein
MMPLSALRLRDCGAFGRWYGLPRIRQIPADLVGSQLRRPECGGVTGCQRLAYRARVVGACGARLRRISGGRDITSVHDEAQNTRLLSDASTTRGGHRAQGYRHCSVTGPNIEAGQ